MVMLMARMLPLALLIAAQAAQAPNPISWSLTPTKAPVRRGEAFTVRLVADIPPGWHLYSINQPEGGPIATQISLPPGQPFTFAKAITESKTHTIFDQAFGLQVRLHSEKAEFGLPLATSGTAAPGAATLAVEVRYQSCTDTLCLPPRTVLVRTPIQINDR
jgi:thiol:disulfide interchange protein DsbD